MEEHHHKIEVRLAIISDNISLVVIVDVLEARHVRDSVMEAPHYSTDERRLGNLFLDPTRKEKNVASVITTIITII